MPRLTAQNSSPLAANAEWASGTLYARQADRVIGTVFADQAGTLHIEQSIDEGQNWDVDTEIAVTADTGVGFSQEVYGPWVRLRFVNGATNQGEFRLGARWSSAGHKA